MKKQKKARNVAEVLDSRLEEMQKIIDKEFPKTLAEQEKDYAGWLKRSGMWMPTPERIQQLLKQRRKKS
jgi:hypothetical protein